MSPDVIAENMRSWLPMIAHPIRPCEPVPSWLKRAARLAGIPAARAQRYWHRRVAEPKAHEYMALRLALEAAQRKQSIMEAAYEIERQRLVEVSPGLAWLLPPSLEKAPDSAEG